MISIIISWIKNQSPRNILLMILFMCFFCIMYFRNIQEGFSIQKNKLIKHEKFSPQNDDCNNNTSTTSCLSNSNCGICLKNKTAKCVQGDSYGPLFCGNCDFWKYNRKINMGKNKDSVHITTRPWNKILKTKDVDRVALQTLGK